MKWDHKQIKTRAEFGAKSTRALLPPRSAVGSVPRQCPFASNKKTTTWRMPLGDLIGVGVLEQEEELPVAGAHLLRVHDLVPPHDLEEVPEEAPVLGVLARLQKGGALGDPK